jgi:hypothetical protein
MEEMNLFRIVNRTKAAHSLCALLTAQLISATFSRRKGSSRCVSGFCLPSSLPVQTTLSSSSSWFLWGQLPDPATPIEGGVDKRHHMQKWEWKERKGKERTASEDRGRKRATRRSCSLVGMHIRTLCAVVSRTSDHMQHTCCGIESQGCGTFYYTKNWLLVNF